MRKTTTTLFWFKKKRCARQAPPAKELSPNTIEQICLILPDFGMNKNSENLKIDPSQTEASHGESDVWRIIQSRTPEPLPNSESYTQDKENVLMPKISEREKIILF